MQTPIFNVAALASIWEDLIQKSNLMDIFQAQIYTECCLFVSEENFKL